MYPIDLEELSHLMSLCQKFSDIFQMYVMQPWWLMMRLLYYDEATPGFFLPILRLSVTLSLGKFRICQNLFCNLDADKGWYWLSKVHIQSPNMQQLIPKIDVEAKYLRITRIMVFKGMVFKSKYCFWEKNKVCFLSECLNIRELKGSHKGIQYWFSFKL